MTVCNQKEFSDRMGVNKGTVTRWKAAGRLVMVSGLVDVEASQARLAETAGGRIDVAARHAQNRGAAIPMPQEGEKNAPAGRETQTAAIDTGITDTSGRQKAQTTRMHFENQQIKLEMALRRGLRFERAAVKREAHGLGAMLRAGIERVIDQTAPRLAAAGNELERRRIIEKEVKKLRWMVKRELPRSLRRMKEAGAKVGAGGTASE